MTVPAAPLPSLGLILSALANSGSAGKSWVRHSSGRVARVYRLGRDALSAAVQAVERETGQKKLLIWFPAYFCNEALAPLRQLEVDIGFYPVCEDLSPDWTILEGLVARERAGQIFVLVHYFGFPNDVRQAREFCERHGLKLLEDAAHVLLPSLSIGEGDIQVFSPRKLLPLPAGGILVVPTEMSAYLVDIPEEKQPAETALWLARRVAQRIMIQLHIPWHLFRRARLSGEGVPSNGGRGTSLESCGPFTLKLLATLEQQLDEVVRRRRYNYSCLLKWAKGLVLCRPLFPVLPEGVCPYVFPLLVERESGEIVGKLQSVGIPASQWPDLPPEVLAEKTKGATALEIRSRLLLLPVHQSLSQEQIDAVSHGVDAVASRRSQVS